MGDLRQLEKKLSLVLFVIAAMLLGYAWYKDKNIEDYYVAPFEWKTEENQIWGKVHETVANTNGTGWWEFSVVSDPTRAAATVWDAEYGFGSLTVTAEFRADKNSKWQEIDPSSIATLQRDGFVKITFRSSRYQSIRLARGNFNLNQQHVRLDTYNNNLCVPRGCADPLTPASQKGTKSEATRSVENMTIIGIFLGVIAVIFGIGLFNILATIFPSGTAHRVRAGLGTGGGYAGTADNTFRREQDLDDLEELLREARHKNAGLAAREEELKNDDDAHLKLVAELEASIEHVKGLSEKVEQAEKKKEGF